MSFKLRIRRLSLLGGWPPFLFSCSCIFACACCVFFCGYLRLCWFCASRGFLTLMAANWPLMLVNGFWLALLAMVVNALWVWCAMVVNGFATAPGCRFACLGLGAPLGFQPAIVKYSQTEVV